MAVDIGPAKVAIRTVGSKKWRGGCGGAVLTVLALQ
jgi:hypothetical protein